MANDQLKTTLVTGATGLVGFNIVQSLLKRNRKVKALVRSKEKGLALLPESVELVQGDILEKSSVQRAMKGCTVVYHAAGWPEQWFRDPKIFHRTNVLGTQNIIDAAKNHNIKKLIYTSTVDVFAGQAGEKFDESIIDPNPKNTIYERSKQRAFQRVIDAANNGLPVISIHPAGVYGPGASSSPGMNEFFDELKKGKVPMLLPGGLPLVFSEDVGEGHVLAEELGNIGDRYILSEGYYTLPEISKMILHELGINKKPPSVMPLPLVKLVSNIGEWAAKITGKPPLIPRGQLEFLLWKAIPVSQKAQNELGWKPTPLLTGIKKTAEYLIK